MDTADVRPFISGTRLNGIAVIAASLTGGSIADFMGSQRT
jgi:hypothetical protein